MHAVMSLTHAVAAADHAELNGGAAGPVDAVLHPLGNLTQVVVTGNAFAPCVGNADDGALQVLGGKAHGLVGGAVVLVAQALQNMFTAVHKAVPPVFRISEFCSCAMRERRQLPFLLSACIIKSRKRYYKSSKTLSTFLQFFFKICIIQRKSVKTQWISVNKSGFFVKGQRKVIR